MKKRLDYENLWNDAVHDTASDEFRTEALRAGLAEMDRSRARRRQTRRAVIILAPVLLLVAVFALRKPQPVQVASNVPAPRAPVVKTVPGTAIEILSDEDLLRVFDGQAVALVGPRGRQQLILLKDFGKDSL